MLLRFYICCGNKESTDWRRHGFERIITYADDEVSVGLGEGLILFELGGEGARLRVVEGFLGRAFVHAGGVEVGRD